MVNIQDAMDAEIMTSLGPFAAESLLRNEVSARCGSATLLRFVGAQNLRYTGTIKCLNKDHHGSLWIIMDYYGSLWIIMDQESLRCGVGNLVCTTAFALFHEIADAATK